MLSANTVAAALGPELASPDGFFAPPADAAHGTRGALLLAGLHAVAAAVLRDAQKQVAALRRVEKGVAALDLPPSGSRGFPKVGLARSSWRLLSGAMTAKDWASLAFSGADAGLEAEGAVAGADDSDEEDEAGAPPAHEADALPAHEGEED